MSRLGPMELIIILLIVVLLFGGRKIPEIAKGLGKGIREFKGAMNGENTDETKSLKKNENSEDSSSKT
ncbi:MAG TPA: twin-arginine translocase TatA/TatE family subunit [Fibrobacteres bacterium]|jgi:sec-independent protein translocase protein TatA|nr:twin-arginine translocase TatA/TatE family subunit [Fibrobacterota bacterium]